MSFQNTVGPDGYLTYWYFQKHQHQRHPLLRKNRQRKRSRQTKNGNFMTKFSFRSSKDGEASIDPCTKDQSTSTHPDTFLSAQEKPSRNQLTNSKSTNTSKDRDSAEDSDSECLIDLCSSLLFLLFQYYPETNNPRHETET